MDWLRRSDRGLLLLPVTVLGALGLSLGAQGCEQVIGLDKFHDVLCVAGDQRPCYDGPSGTEGVGICKGGTQTCSDDGMSWGKCNGAVLPAEIEDCGNNLDDDCNGTVNDLCACVPGTMGPCYDGPMGTEGNGICHGGMHTCNEHGNGYGPCMGEQTPKPEDCSTPVDDNCDGHVNEASAGCGCVPGDMQPCYSGPMGTEGVGICAGGMQACNQDGLGYGACMGDVTPQPEDCSDAIDNDCDGFACSRTIWAEQFGNGPYQQATRVAVNKLTGDVYVGGFFTGAIKFGNDTLIDAGGGDAFLARLDAKGAPVWAKRFGSPTPGAYEFIVALAVDSTGNVVIVSQGDLGAGTNVMKLAPDGTTIWAKACGSVSAAFSQAHEVAVDPQGDVLVAGDFKGAITCSGTSLMAAGTTNDDVFVAKLSGVDGNPAWIKQYGGTGEERVSRIAADVNGNVYLAGLFFENVSFGGAGNTVYINGNGTNPDVFLAKLTPAGAISFVRQFGDASYQGVSALAVDGLGEIVLSGGYQGTISLFGSALTLSNPSTTVYKTYIAKLDGGGNGVWLSDIAPIGALAVDSHNDVLLTAPLLGSSSFGGPMLTSAGGADVAVAKLRSSDGAMIWNRIFGDASDQTPSWIAAGKFDEAVVVGNFKGTLAFDGATLTASGTSTEIFVGEIAP